MKITSREQAFEELEKRECIEVLTQVMIDDAYEAHEPDEEGYYSHAFDSGARWAESVLKSRVVELEKLLGDGFVKRDKIEREALELSKKRLNEQSRLKLRICELEKAFEQACEAAEYRERVLECERGTCDTVDISTMRANRERLLK